jgi:D-serine deaminase-like pyridoxal phosphate-dependent protein
MDHGNPELEGSQVWFCSDEHTTFSPPRPVGDRVWLIPAHVDPTMAMHERLYLYSGEDVVGCWPIDLRGW